MHALVTTCKDACQVQQTTFSTPDAGMGPWYMWPDYYDIYTVNGTQFQALLFVTAAAAAAMSSLTGNHLSAQVQRRAWLCCSVRYPWQ